MTNKFISKVIPPKSINSGLAFIFRNNEILINKISKESPLPYFSKGLQASVMRQHYLGIFNDIHCMCFEVDTIELSENWQFQPLKNAFEHLGETFFAIAGRALHILQWDKDHQFCSRCGIPLIVKADERAKVCPQCQLHFYPKLSPSIIVAIMRGREILLARSPRFPPGNYSVLAGFIEPGETAEEAVEREVYEEVGLTVKNIQYFGTQHWPFPDSFMLGYTADYDSGEIAIDKQEIEDARWFDIDHMPPLPSKISIARHLIDNFTAKNKSQ